MFLLNFCTSLATQETPGYWLLFAVSMDRVVQLHGYVVSQLVEEVHSAIDSGNTISLEFAWVRYITDWSRSGPGFFTAYEHAHLT